MSDSQPISTPPVPSASGSGAAFGQMVSKARHDLRNPIGHILGFTEMMLEEAQSLGYEHFCSDLDTIGQSANDLIALINQCLDPHKLESGHCETHHLKDHIATLTAKIGRTSERLAHLSRALKEDVFSVDLARIGASARQVRELAESSLAFLAELGYGQTAPAPPPLAHDEPAPSLAEEPIQPPQSLSGGSILVVDDLEENRELLLRRLSRLGYAVHLAENGRQALEFIHHRAVDLILLDIMMPELDGFQTLNRLKENPVTRFIPVIMLSSSDDSNTVVRCIKMGADDFLPKPFNTTLLTARIEASLAKKRLREIKKEEFTYYFDKGTLQADSPSYVERRSDRELLNGLVKGDFCYVLTSRQMGKSSLMVRTANRLREQGINVVALDLTAIGQNLTPEQWYDGLVLRMGRQIHLEDELDDFWLDNKRLSPVQRLFTAIREVVLKKHSKPLVVFVDELDTVRSLPFSTDEFFAAIRECYNRRAVDSEYARLTFCLLGVATPSDLIRDTRATPFNIGRRIELADFTTDEAAPLALGLGREPGTAHGLLQRILYWTNGHPYLTQRFCRAIAQDNSICKPSYVDQLCERLFLTARAREEDDNLVFVRKLLLQNEADSAEVLRLYGQIRRRRKKAPEEETNRLVNVLRLSGLVRLNAGYLEVRNRIYFRVFDQGWIKANLPEPSFSNS